MKSSHWTIYYNCRWRSSLVCIARAEKENKKREESSIIAVAVEDSHTDSFIYICRLDNYQKIRKGIAVVRENWLSNVMIIFKSKRRTTCRHHQSSQANERTRSNDEIQEGKEGRTNVKWLSRASSAFLNRRDKPMKWHPKKSAGTANLCLCSEKKQSTGERKRKKGKERE